MQKIELSQDDEMIIVINGSKGRQLHYNVTVEQGILTVVSEDGNLIILPGGECNCVGLDVYNAQSPMPVMQ